MEFLLLIPAGFVGAVFWFVSTEGLSIYYGTMYHPLAVGITAAVGQNLMYVVLYFGGEQLVNRWAWLGKQVEQLRTRWQRRLETSYLATTALASLTGVPPNAGMVALAAGFRIKFRWLITVTLIFRSIRFTVLAAAGEMIFRWIGCAPPTP